MGALSYVFDCRHTSASTQDVMKVASFFYVLENTYSKTFLAILLERISINCIDIKNIL